MFLTKLQDELFSGTTAVMNEPKYYAEPGILERYGNKAIEVLKAADSEVRPIIRGLSLSLTDAEPYERDLKVVISDLPTIYKNRLFLVKRGRWIVPVIKRVPLGKIFGAYDPDDDTIRVHYGIFSELSSHDPDKKMLEDLGIEYQSPKEVITHERSHRIQDKTGAINKYNSKSGPKARGLIEGIATKTTEYLLNKQQKTYQVAKNYAERLISRYGFRRVFLGDVPQNDPIVMPDLKLAYQTI